MQSLINLSYLTHSSQKGFLKFLLIIYSSICSVPSLPHSLEIQSMGCAPEQKFRQRRRNLVFFWLFLVITSWSGAKGRATPKLAEVEDGLEFTQMKKTEENVVTMRRVLIGSRPPRCERRCSSCGGPCEAVQVPIVPSKVRDYQARITSHHQFYATPTIAYSRGDNISNYKPMCWKCKCGNFMFNP